MEKVYWKKNVNYNIGVRFFVGDKDGAVLTGSAPLVAVDADKIREFKLANKAAIINGLIVPGEEPSIEWETDNVITDDEMIPLVKNFTNLKKKLPKISSLPILFKLLEEGKKEDVAKRNQNAIQARIDELDNDDDNFSMDPEEIKGEMKGVL